MKKTYLVIVMSILFIICISTSYALMLNINPASQDAMIGSTADASVVISGLGDMMPDSLSAFDIDVSFDSSVLAFNSISFGDQLDLFGLGSIQGYNDSTPGLVNLFEISLDMPWDLDDYQAGSFTLATLTFDALGFGTSSLDLSVIALGDAWGDPLTVDSIQNGEVNVVPEPATILLLGSGLAGIGYLRRKRKL